jgi:hypothetical protein
MKKLLQISAFYKNDVEEGLGITLTEDFCGLGEFMQIITLHYDLMWTMSQKANDLPVAPARMRSALSLITRRLRNTAYALPSPTLPLHPSES